MVRIKNLIVKNWAIILILLVSAFLRLYKIRDYMTFLGDEGRDAIVVYNILHGKFTLLGPTASVGGFFLGPIYYYFMAVFTFLFNYDPVGPSVMVALFGIFTVWLVYKIANEFFGKKAAITASLLYAISPVVIAYSRSSWNPNLMPPFTLLTLYILYKGIVKNKFWLFFIVGILFGILMQLHYIEVFVGVIIVVYVLLAQFLKDRKSIQIGSVILNLLKTYLTIFTGFIAGFSPYLAFESRHGFPNTASIIKFIFHSPEVGGSVNLFATIGSVFFRLFARLVAGFPPPEQLGLYNRALISLWSGLILVIAIVSFIYFLFKAYKLVKQKDTKSFAYLLFVVWFVLGIFFFGFYRKAIYDYYFEFMFPLPFFLIGFLAEFLLNQRRIVKFATLLALGLLVLLNLNGIPFRYPPNRQLNQMETIAKFVFTRTDAKPYNFALLSGSNSDHAYRYFFTVWGHSPITIEYVGKDPQRKTVTDQLFVVCETLPCESLGNSLWEIAGFGRAEIAGSWDVSVVKIYKLVHYKGK
jgi:4-amino-4-deoxy-L-arabinose transferase-like glycosyltransferase